MIELEGQNQAEIRSHGRYVLKDSDLPEWYRGVEFIDPLLSESEIELLLSASGHGIKVVPQLEFDDVEQFKNKQNNFWNYFSDTEGSMLHYIVRRKKVFQRISILNPDLVHSLVARFQQLTEEQGTPIVKIDNSLWQDLFEAYKQMSQLVDESDSYVVREKTGHLDDWYLCR